MLRAAKGQQKDSKGTATFDLHREVHNICRCVTSGAAYYLRLPELFGEKYQELATVPLDLWTEKAGYKKLQRIVNSARNLWNGKHVWSASALENTFVRC